MTKAATKKICGAKTKKGTPCQRAPMANGRCVKHGGKTPGGIASPNYRTGKYSKYLPADLRGKYIEATQDKDLLSIRDDIALHEVRVIELLEKGKTNGVSNTSMRDALSSYKDLQQAIDKQDTLGTIQAINELGNALNSANENNKIWEEVSRTIESKRRLVETEQKRLIAMQQFITADAAYGMILSIARIIKKHVKDQRAIRNISADLEQFLVQKSD